LAVEVRQTAVDIVEFKPTVVGYTVLIHDPRGQVHADDFDVRELVGNTCGPERKRIKSTQVRVKIFLNSPNREVLTRYRFHNLRVGRRQLM
jgi:hypothetical protein